MNTMRRQTCTRCGGTGRELDWRKVGRSIRNARKMQGLGVRELARLAGCSGAYVVDIESGKHNGGLSGAKTRAVMTILGLSAEDVT